VRSASGFGTTLGNGAGLSAQYSKLKSFGVHARQYYAIGVAAGAVKINLSFELII
jgi:hypothetical protein